MYRRLEQRGARRASARALAWRLHHENPRKIGRLRGYHRLRPDRRRSLRRASLRNPARYRARHSAARRHLRQRLRQQGQSGRRKSAWHRSGHPAQGQRKEQASLLRPHPLQSPRTHRAGHRTAQALQARRAPLRKDRTKLQINRQLRRRPLLDQIRPHGLLLVHMALQQFPGSPKYRSLPRSIQVDIKAFFASQANALMEARRLLFSAGDRAAIRADAEARDCRWSRRDEGRYQVPLPIVDPTPAAYPLAGARRLCRGVTRRSRRLRSRRH